MTNDFLVTLFEHKGLIKVSGFQPNGNVAGLTFAPLTSVNPWQATFRGHFSAVITYTVAYLLFGTRGDAALNSADYFATGGNMDASVEENIKGFNFFGDQTTNTDVTAKCSDAFNFGPTNCQRFGGALATANFPPSEQLDITDLLSGFAGGGSRVGIAAFTQAFVLSPLKVTGTDNQTVFFSDGTAIDFPMSGSITFLIPGVLLLFMSYRRLKGRGENQTLAV